MRTFLIARTEKEGWRAIGKYEDAIPELTEAIIVTTHGGKWLEGARMQRTYIAPGAESGPRYERVIRVAEWNMRKTRTADGFFRQINPDGSWTERGRDGLRVEQR
jgi:hypothetical protein